MQENAHATSAKSTLCVVCLRSSLPESYPNHDQVGSSKSWSKPPSQTSTLENQQISDQTHTRARARATPSGFSCCPRRITFPVFGLLARKHHKRRSIVLKLCILLHVLSQRKQRVHIKLSPRQVLANSSFTRLNTNHTRTRNAHSAQPRVARHTRFRARPSLWWSSCGNKVRNFVRCLSL